LLRFATEQALAADFPAFEVGALPPLGGLLHCPELIDTRLLGPHRILCNGGDHRHSVVLEARELQRVSGGQAGDLAAARSDEIYIAAPVRKPAAR
jgi:prolyl-tRNA editing enzyme YbaK/EbsC (Cys-tRNA(Pro) deacylase)